MKGKAAAQPVVVDDPYASGGTVQLRHGFVAILSETPINIDTAKVKEHEPLGEGPLRARTRRDG